MMSPQRKIDPQMLVSIGVLFISFSALIVSIRQSIIMNRQTEVLLDQTKASAWPYLEISLLRSFSDSGQIKGYEIKVINRGTGPAIIEGVRILYDGKPVKNWGDFYEAITIPDSLQGHSNGALHNTVIPSNASNLIIHWNDNPVVLKWVFEQGDKITMEICYRSVFNEHWLLKRVGFKTNLEVAERKEIETCQLKPEEYFME